jgi:hypothetical protein
MVRYPSLLSTELVGLRHESHDSSGSGVTVNLQVQCGGA